MKILFIGDVFGRPGRRVLRRYLGELKDQHDPELTVVNAENAAVLMPVESVLEIAKENLNSTNYNQRFTEWMDNKLNSSREIKGISSQYGPVKYIKDAAYPDNPYQLMNRRFQLFFETFSV